jgi:hypothetical protein
MADFQLLNNEVYDFPLVTRDAAGAIVPANPTDVDTVATAATAIAATLGTMPGGGPSVHIVPLVQLSDGTNGGGGLVVNITDSDGLPMAGVPTFSVVNNLAPASVGVDVTGVVTTSQPVPAAAGP